MGSFNTALWNFLSEDGRALCLSFTSKFKVQTNKTLFNTEVSCTVSTMLHQAAFRGIFQPDLICGSMVLTLWEEQE